MSENTDADGRTNLVDSHRCLYEGDDVQDGNANATVVDRSRGEFQIEYDDGAAMWLQENRFVWSDRGMPGWEVV